MTGRTRLVDDLVPRVAKVKRAEERRLAREEEQRREAQAASNQRAAALVSSQEAELETKLRKAADEGETEVEIEYSVPAEEWWHWKELWHARANVWLDLQGIEITIGRDSDDSKLEGTGGEVHHSIPANRHWGKITASWDYPEGA